jgi:hypothetical protein
MKAKDTKVEIVRENPAGKAPFKAGTQGRIRGLCVTSDDAPVMNKNGL